jgi:hypothetical protein
MGLSISHGGPANTISGAQIHNLGQKLQAVARPADAAVLDRLFAPRSDAFNVKPREAEKIGNALHSAASRLRLWDRDWARLARQIGDSALLAARLGEPWRWS